MDRQLLERMVGAGVLIVALVLLVPAILDGNGGTEGQSADPAINDEPAEMRTHTIRLDRQPERPPVAQDREPIEDPVPEVAKPSTDTVGAEPKPAPQPAVQPAATRPPPVKPKPAPAPREPTPDSGWAVQLGSFAEQGNARRLAQEVEQRGFASYLMPLERSGRTLYRVRVGPKETRGQAEALAGKLATAGFRGQVTPQQPDS